MDENGEGQTAGCHVYLQLMAQRLEMCMGRMPLEHPWSLLNRTSRARWGRRGTVHVFGGQVSTFIVLVTAALDFWDALPGSQTQRKLSVCIEQSSSGHLPSVETPSPLRSNR